jgi:peptidoglycan hydrolase CwlO-like protein
MSIWFTRDRSQTSSVMTDDQHVGEDAPSSRGSERAIDALRAAANDRARDDISEVWQLHEAAVEAEYQTHRLLAGGAARRQLRDALIAEAEALHRLGYDSFASFAAANGWKRPEEHADHDGDDSIARISELLGELGLEAGEDPLAAAKQFLGTVDSTTLDAPLMMIAARPDASVPEAETPTPEELDITRDFDDSDVEAERADARAERWHAELEQVRGELTASIAEREAAERAVEAARREFAPLREELISLQQSIEASSSDLQARIAERDAAMRAREEFEAQLATARAELDGRGRERDDARTQLSLAHERIDELELAITAAEEAERTAAAELADKQARIEQLHDTLAVITAERDGALVELERTRLDVARLETVVAAHEAEREAMQQDVANARAQMDDLAAQLEGTQSTLDALAAHAEEIEAELEATRRSAATAGGAPSRFERVRGDASEPTDRARADADALREQAMREAEAIRRDALVTADGIRRIAQEDARQLQARITEAAFADAERTDRMAALVDRVGRMERKLSKQRRRLEKTIGRLERARRAEHPPAADRGVRARREADDLRAAAELQRRRTRDELISLLARLVRDAEGPEY